MASFVIVTGGGLWTERSNLEMDMRFLCFLYVSDKQKPCLMSFKVDPTWRPPGTMVAKAAV